MALIALWRDRLCQTLSSRRPVLRVERDRQTVTISHREILGYIAGDGDARFA